MGFVKKVLFVIGTRPEAIKMAPVIKAFQAGKADFETLVCCTGQHQEMVTSVLELFGIRPNFITELDYNPGTASLNILLARVLTFLDEIIQKTRPDWVMVQGDTTSALAGGMAAFHHKINAGHIEAGLRTFNYLHPYPEEMNRVVLSRLATLHFAPTNAARNNLIMEGIPEKLIFITGNPVADAIRMVKAMNESIEPAEIVVLRKRLPALGIRKTLTVTVHRRENQGSNLRNICEALKEISREVQIVIPVHPNPLVKTVIEEELSGYPGIELLPPLPYPAFIWLMDHSDLLISDSGGIQEEAALLGKPVIVLRAFTERREVIESGNAVCIAPEKLLILHTVYTILEDEPRLKKMSVPNNIFGDGYAGNRIMEIIKAASYENNA